MWRLLGLLCCLPPGSSAVPLQLSRALALAKNEPSQGLLRTSSPSLAPPPTAWPPHSEAPAMSLNLGLNFKIKLRSQGKGRLGEGPGEASGRPRLPPARPVAPTPSQARGGPRLWPEALGGSGWLGTGPAEELPSGPGGGAAWHSSLAPAAAPTPQQPLALWPRLTERGLVVPTGENSKELEFKVDIDLTAGLGQEAGLASNSSSSRRRQWYPLLPGLRVGISEIASKLAAPGLFGSTLPPETWEPPPERNGTSHTREHPGDSRPPTPVWASESGPESRSVAASPGSEGAFVALPACLPSHPEDCGSPLPEPGTPPLFLPAALPLFVPLHSDWNTALAAWGLAWQAHLYGAGSLFALLALLCLPALLCSPCRSPAAGRKLLALLHLLLGGAGGARAVLLFGDACGQLELFPSLAVRLLHDLALPCFTSALAIALLLLSLRPSSLQRSHPAGLRHPCLPAGLLLLNFSVATGAALLLHQVPLLLLASRGLFALLAALLSSALLSLYCFMAPVDSAAQIQDGLKKSSTSSRPPGSCCCCCCRPFADAAQQWSCAARTALPSACFGLLSAGLHTYAILHALGYGLPAELFGPWAWWALQLACRLCEVGMGLPLALLSLCPVFCAPGSEPWCQCCGGHLPCLPLDRAAAAAAAVKKTQVMVPPNHFPRAPLSQQQHQKLVICDPVAGTGSQEADYLPLCALPAAAEPGGGGCLLASSSSISTAANDPTADFCPPSPIDLRRSIDEALCSEGLFQGGGSSASSSSTLSSLNLAASSSSSREPWPAEEGGPSQAASCTELVPAQSLAPSCSSSTAPGTYGSPPASPPPPGRPCRALSAPTSQESLAASAGKQAADAALLREEFLDVCRQIDALSVASDTIEL